MKSKLQGATVTFSCSNLMVFWPFPKHLREMVGNYRDWHGEWNIRNSVILLAVSTPHSLKSTIHHAEMVGHVLVTCRRHLSDYICKTSSWKGRRLKKIRYWKALWILMLGDLPQMKTLNWTILAPDVCCVFLKQISIRSHSWALTRGLNLQGATPGKHRLPPPVLDGYLAQLMQLSCISPPSPTLSLIQYFFFYVCDIFYG